MISNPTLIERECVDADFKAAIERLTKRAMSEGERAFATESTDTSHRDFETLLAGGFPKRAVMKLTEMYGPGLQKAKELFPRIEGDSIIALIGPRGPGKTQIATFLAWQRRVRSGKYPGRYVKALDFYSQLRKTYSGQGNELSVVAPLRKTGFLVIDEIQVCSGSEWEKNWLSNLIDHRYDSMKPTLLCGNLNAEKLKAEVGTSIYSRMAETGGVVVCDWPSYRERRD